MAKVTDVFFSGTIRNVMFYHRMGTNCARWRALHVKQSVATKIRPAIKNAILSSKYSSKFSNVSTIFFLLLTRIKVTGHLISLIV